MKKEIMDLVLTHLTVFSDGLALLDFGPAAGDELPPMLPGQFVEVQVPGADVLLNRPISVFDASAERLRLLVRPAGRATKALINLPEGAVMRIIGPLGRGFSTDSPRPLLVGGGVGVAPLYMLAKAYGTRPTLIMGMRTAPDRALTDILSEVAEVKVCTDDGSAGHHGLVTTHPVLSEGGYDKVQCCGPLPMMKGVAAVAAQAGKECEVSLENKMACGLGACLCCVENTTTGNRCVCTDGPVFNTRELLWHD